MPADVKPAAMPASRVIPPTPSVGFDAALVRKLNQIGPISQLICNFELDYARLAIPGGVDARVYFAVEIERLKPLEDEGLLCIGSKGLKVKMRGRLLIRNICMAFDSYLHAPLPEGPALARYSRTI